MTCRLKPYCEPLQIFFRITFVSISSCTFFEVVERMLQTLSCVGTGGYLEGLLYFLSFLYILRKTD